MFVCPGNQNPTIASSRLSVSRAGSWRRVQNGNLISFYRRRLGRAYKRTPSPRTRAEPTWRYVTGAFQIKIPVTTEEKLLGPEENTLAILKARLAAMSPLYRWYPVLQRYIQVVSGRVNGSGGDAGTIPASLQGYPPAKGPGHGSGPGHGGGHEPGPDHGHDGNHDCDHDHGNGCTGKICGLVFDRFGDFEGFLLDTEEGEHHYTSREEDIFDLVDLAWRERLRVTVFATHELPHRPATVILRDPPARFHKP